MCVSRHPLLSLLRCAVLPSALSKSSVRAASARELRQFGRLAELAEIDTYRPISKIFLNTDASERGGAVVTSRATCNEIDALLTSNRYNGGLLHRYATAVRNFVKARPWRVVIPLTWTHDAHIHELEAAAVLLAVRWFANHHRGNARFLILSDSAMFLGVLTVGRSSSSGLMRYARYVAAIALARNIDLLLAHVPTDINPADRLSRVFVPPGTNVSQ